MSRPSVAHTTDFDRIAALPRRDLAAIDAEVWATELTSILREPRATASLRPAQAVAILEALEARGAWLALPVGAGKTLIYYALLTLVGAERSLIIVPASLEDKTWADFRSYRGTWRSPSAPFNIVTREWLVYNPDYLTQYNPRLLMIDESDTFANADAGATRIIDRFVVANPDVRIVVGSGTPGRMSIMNYWHIVMWCLREDAPLPLRQSEAEMWAAALDEKIREPSMRPSPGPLGVSTPAARDWYRARLAETPGIVILDGDSCDQPLTIRTRCAREDAAIDLAMRDFMRDMQNPGGIYVTDPLCRWTLDTQIGTGYYTYYDPPPPDEWREARRYVAKLVRDKIAASVHWNRPLDTERMVLARYPEHPAVVRWRAVKGAFDPARHTRVAWISDSALHSCAEWLAEIDRPGIVWCGGVDFGHRLAELTGLAYYGRLGRARDGTGLHAAPRGKSIICSWNANKHGFNLQAWPRQLIAQPPQSAKWLEQIIGRSHRSLQSEPVEVDLLMGSGGSIDAFEAAIKEAAFVHSTLGLTEKILRATIMRCRPQINSSNKYRWATRSKER